VNRPWDGVADVTYTIPEAVRTGKLFVTLETFSQANQRGRQLQIAQDSVFPDASGFLPDMDLRAGFGAVRTAELVLSGASTPASSITEVRVGQDVYVSPLMNTNSGYQLPLATEFRWELFYPESGNTNFASITAQNEPSLQHIFRAERSGLVNLTFSIDGVKSNTLQFRAVP
jgi:hypothetical protein